MHIYFITYSSVFYINLLYSLLDMIPDLFSETRETDVILGPVVQAGMEALKVVVVLISTFISEIPAYQI